MPYILPKRRMYLDEQINTLVDAVLMEAENTMDLAGLANYCITRFVTGLMQNVDGKTNYATFALFEGVLSHVSKEIYRRLTSDYENAKILENGDLEEFKK